jgi:ketol-acid reductoisomerase
MKNYYNTLSEEQKKQQLGKCDFLDSSEFANGTAVLKGKKVVIIGCGSQGLNQGLNMRDSGLHVSFALRAEAIETKRKSYQNALLHGFEVGTYDELLPSADLVINLTPDKQHTGVVSKAMPLMKYGATLSYSHGFNVVEEGMKIREDLTVILMAPKSPGSEVREEYKRGFGVPTLIAVHEENNPNKTGFEWAKAYAYATGGHRAGVLHSSFVAEVKSDLMGEQTILCGVLQTGSIWAFEKMIENGVEPGRASNLIQYGWESIAEELKKGGLTQMLEGLTAPQKLKVYELSEELKSLMTSLFKNHMSQILSGEFSEGMMKDWLNDDENLLTWRAETRETSFEKTAAAELRYPQAYYFENGTLLLAFVKSGVELAYETMVDSGIKEESAYYESLHELPLIANTIARKKLYEMNQIISDTAEYGCYLFDQECRPLLSDFMNKIDAAVMGENYTDSAILSEYNLHEVNKAVENHSIEHVGKKLREAMTMVENQEEYV